MKQNDAETMASTTSHTLNVRNSSRATYLVFCRFVAYRMSTKSHASRPLQRQCRVSSVSPARRPRWSASSWLKLVERWFAELTGKRNTRVIKVSASNQAPLGVVLDTEATPAEVT